MNTNTSLTSALEQLEAFDALLLLADNPKAWADNPTLPAFLRAVHAALKARPGVEEVARLGQIIRTMRQVYDAQLSEFDCGLEDEDTALVVSLQDEADAILALFPASLGGDLEGRPELPCADAQERSPNSSETSGKNEQ